MLLKKFLLISLSLASIASCGCKAVPKRWRGDTHHYHAEALGPSVSAIENQHATTRLKVQPSDKYAIPTQLPDPQVQQLICAEDDGVLPPYSAD